MKKYLILVAVLIAVVGLTLGAVSAEGWSFNFGSSSSSNSDGGQYEFTNGALKLQDLTFKIPDGYKENESAKKLAEPAVDLENAKYSLAAFDKDGKQIIVKVFFSDDDKFTSLSGTNEGDVNKTVAGIDGVYNNQAFSDGSVEFKFLKDGKLADVIAQDDATLESILK